MDLKCKKRIVEWIVANPGFVYSMFTFVPQYENEVLPSEEQFESLTYIFDNWELTEEARLDGEEQEMYPGATKRFRYTFKPLKDTLVAHLFADNENVLYVVLAT